MFLETKKETYKDVFLKQMDWLVDNITRKNNYGVWQHFFQLPYYEFDKIPWSHGMAQGLAVSLLLRAYQISNVQKYFNTAQQAYYAFFVDINDDGVQYTDEHGKVWIE